jgi:hypothetical protein
MRKINRNQTIIYAIIFISIFLLTFFWLDHREKGVNVYRDAPVPRETQIITERYRIKRLESRIRDLRSGDYKKRIRALGRGDLEMSDDMIRKEITAAEKNLQQAKKHLAKLLRK